MGGGSSRALMQGNRWLFVGENGARLSTQFAWRCRGGDSLAGIQNKSLGRMRLPALYRGRCMMRVHCLAYPVLRTGMSKGLSGFAEGPLCFGVARGLGRAPEMRRFSRSRTTLREAKGGGRSWGGPRRGACAVPTFSGSNYSSKRRWRRPQVSISAITAATMNLPA
jgi:hypothetical protein